MADPNAIVNWSIFAAGLVAFIVLLIRDKRAFEQINRERFSFWQFYAQFWTPRFKMDKKTDTRWQQRTMFSERCRFAFSCSLHGC